HKSSVVVLTRRRKASGAVAGSARVLLEATGSGTSDPEWLKLDARSVPVVGVELAARGSVHVEPSHHRGGEGAVVGEHAGGVHDDRRARAPGADEPGVEGVPVVGGGVGDGIGVVPG